MIAFQKLSVSLSSRVCQRSQFHRSQRSTDVQQLHDLQVEDVGVLRLDPLAQRRSTGAPSRLMRATAASAPSKTMFSVSCTFRLRLAQVVEHVREHARAVAVAHDEHVRRRRPRREVHDVRHPAGLLVAADDADGLGGNRLLRLVGGRADVMRAVDARQRDQASWKSAGRAAGSLAKTSRPTRSPLSRTAAASAA